ncbi:MAG: phosphoribulokinase [Ruminococcaceae bacterium]|nr:phosphoribulokinase [Oscillospiraceae bacterium]
MGSVVFAIEGGSASGKTTLSRLLEQLYDCTVFHMDDFFLRPEQRTPERYKEPGGNIDRERFLEEVLLPMAQNQEVIYRRFDCSTFSLLPPEIIVPQKLTVIEGAYCMHPELAGYYDLSLFLETSPELQKKRIHKRNSPEMAERFFTQWIPLEHRYFDAFQIKERCDYKICIEDQ